MRLVTLVLIALLVLTQAELWFGKGGMQRRNELGIRISPIRLATTASSHLCWSLLILALYGSLRIGDMLVI